MATFAPEILSKQDKSTTIFLVIKMKTAIVCLASAYPLNKKAYAVIARFLSQQTTFFLCALIFLL